MIFIRVLARCLCRPLSCRVLLMHFGLFGLGTRTFHSGYSLGFSLPVPCLGAPVCLDMVVCFWSYTGRCVLPQDCCVVFCSFRMIGGSVS